LVFFFNPHSAIRIPQFGGLACGKILLDKPSFCGMRKMEITPSRGDADEKEIPYLGLGNPSFFRIRRPGLEPG
jgi:hypothetical protein